MSFDYGRGSGGDGYDPDDAGGGYPGGAGHDAGYGYDDDATWSQAGPRQRWILICMVSVLAVLLVTGMGYVAVTLKGRDRTPIEPAAAAVTPSLSPTSGAVSTPAAASSTAAASSSSAARPSSRSSSAKPKRSIAPPKETKLPPPPPAPAPTGCQGTLTGPNATRAVVRQQLDAAAQKAFSRSVPTLRIPSRLLYAVAWQESGWQSAIVACDGGIGTMQVMPNTATWMNSTYETSWDVRSVNGNIMLGGQFLAWLTKYFGDQLGSYDLAAADTTLLDAVIAAYNYGPAAIDLTKGREGIPNWSYVNNVRALMGSCPCTTG